MKLEDFETDLEKNAFILGKIEEFKSVISLAQTALKIPILINGGAAIAILALIGNTWSKNSLSTDLAKSLLFFSFGVLLAAIGTGVSYLTQYRFLQKNEDTITHIFRYLVIACIIISYILFMAGSYWSYYTFSNLENKN